MERLERSITGLEHEVRSLEQEIDQLLNLLQQERQTCREERETLQAQIDALKRQLAFYMKLDRLFYDALAAPISQAMELARAIGDSAREEGRRIVEEALEERERLLGETDRSASRSRELEPAPAVSGETAERRAPALQAADAWGAAAQPEEQIELIIMGLTSFSQVIGLHNALQALPEVSAAMLHEVRQDSVRMRVRHHSELNLVTHLLDLPGFALQLLSQSPGVLRLELRDADMGRAASVGGAM